MSADDAQPNERDCQISELVDLVEHLSTFLSHSYPQEDIWKADAWASAAIDRYRSGNAIEATSAAVQHGRELAAQEIEDEARAMEAQFGIVGGDSLTSRAAAASGALWEAARIARSESPTDQYYRQKGESSMNLRPETIAVCRELLSKVGIRPDAPDAVTEMQRFVAAHQELFPADNDQEPDLSPDTIALFVGLLSSTAVVAAHQELLAAYQAVPPVPEDLRCSANS